MVTWKERFLRRRAWTCLQNLARPRMRPPDVVAGTMACLLRQTEIEIINAGVRRKQTKDLPAFRSTASSCDIYLYCRWRPDKGLGRCGTGTSSGAQEVRRDHDACCSLDPRRSAPRRAWIHGSCTRFWLTCDELNAARRPP
jgi:hypothetical protein